MGNKLAQTPKVDHAGMQLQQVEQQVALMQQQAMQQRQEREGRRGKGGRCNGLSVLATLPFSHPERRKVCFCSVPTSRSLPRLRPGRMTDGMILRGVVPVTTIPLLRENVARVICFCFDADQQQTPLDPPFQMEEDPHRMNPSPLRRKLETLARPRQPEALPVAFDRKRIYILPTAFGLFFIVLLMTMGIGALNYNNNPALLLCLLLGGAANTSLIAAHLQLSGLRSWRIDAEPVPAGTNHWRCACTRGGAARERRGCGSNTATLAAPLSLDTAPAKAHLSLPKQTRGLVRTGNVYASPPASARLRARMGLRLARRTADGLSGAEVSGTPLPEGRGGSARTSASGRR